MRALKYKKYTPVFFFPMGGHLSLSLKAEGIMWGKNNAS